MEYEIDKKDILNNFENINKEINSDKNSYFFKIKKFHVLFILGFFLIGFIILSFISLNKQDKNEIKKQENKMRILKELNKDNENLNETDKENCLVYDSIKKECSKCNLGYKLVNGKCKVNYSFKATYYSNSKNKTINLINPKYIKDIIEMSLNNESIPISSNYIFSDAGNHTIYFLMKNPLNNSLSKMFSGLNDLFFISFTGKYNIENITDISEMFSYCSSLISIDLSNLNTKNVLYMNNMFLAVIN